MDLLSKIEERKITLIPQRNANGWTGWYAEIPHEKGSGTGGEGSTLIEAVENALFHAAFDDSYEPVKGSRVVLVDVNSQR